MSSLERQLGRVSFGHFSLALLSGFIYVCRD
jgi:hypothetical protein